MYPGAIQKPSKNEAKEEHEKSSILEGFGFPSGVDVGKFWVPWMPFRLQLRAKMIQNGTHGPSSACLWP